MASYIQKGTASFIHTPTHPLTFSDSKSVTKYKNIMAS